ncbi:MAG TPA: hypothetical protein VNY27_00380, partial [Solirubrobacteraceae bacterium]|nr:hypothetical protein [Solirubrobacteraceae bacterium]
MHGNRGSRPPVRRYLCSGRRHGHGCEQPITKAEPLENQPVECQATFAVLMSRLRQGLLVLRLRQWMYRRMRRAWVAWSGWSVPASV